MAKEEQFQQTKSLDNFTTEKVNVITNCLFGNYVDGVYVISDEIKKELLEDRKVKKSVFKNSVFCSAYIVGYGDVVFEATFQKNTVKNVAKAELFVLENEYRVNGYIQNTIRTKIAEFISGLENFIENAYEYFHIVITENGVKEYNLKEDISLNAYISAKKNFNLNMDKLTAKDYNKIYKKYVTSRLEKLKKINNGFSQQVLDKFNGEFAKIEKYFLRDNNYKAVSELLDKCIEDCVGVNPKLKKDEQEVFSELTPLVDELSSEATSIAEAAHDKAMSHLDKKERTKVDEIEARVEAGRYDGRVETPSKTDNKPVAESSSVAPTTSGTGRAGGQKPPIRITPTREDVNGEAGNVMTGSVLNRGDYATAYDEIKQNPKHAEEIVQEVTERMREGQGGTTAAPNGQAVGGQDQNSGAVTKETSTTTTTKAEYRQRINAGLAGSSGKVTSAGEKTDKTQQKCSGNNQMEMRI